MRSYELKNGKGQRQSGQNPHNGKVSWPYRVHWHRAYTRSQLLIAHCLPRVYVCLCVYDVKQPRPPDSGIYINFSTFSRRNHKYIREDGKILSSCKHSSATIHVLLPLLVCVILIWRIQFYALPIIFHFTALAFHFISLIHSFIHVIFLMVFILLLLFLHTLALALSPFRCVVLHFCGRFFLYIFKHSHFFRAILFFVFQIILQRKNIFLPDRQRKSDREKWGG